jgi:hypothetical protein
MKASGAKSSRERFVGTWKLISYEIQDEDGHSRYPLGEDAVGVIVYDHQGNMTGQMMKAKRHRYASDDLGKGTPEEIVPAAKSYVAYFGTYVIDENEQSVTHIVEGSLFPNWVGTFQKRFFRFTRDTLILSAGFTAGGRKRTAILTWKRAH